MAVVEHVTNKEIQSNGKFERQPNRFTTPFGDGENELPVEKGRYRLLWAPVCPWANRSMIVRSLLGLEDAISVGTLDPIRPEVPWPDWAFTLDEDDKDPVLGIKLLSEAYKKADPDYDGRYTVPALVDVESGKVVNNDYFNLTLYFETKWEKFHKEGAPDLYPEELRKDIDELNQFIFHDVNNGVYKAGFAKRQEPYSEAYNLVFNAFDKLEERLSTSRFLFGDYITESDIRLYVTLARFDIAYFNGFRVNKKMLKDYPNLWGYTRDLYEEDAFKKNTNFDAIKRHYHLCCLETNPKNILPLGPDLSIWNEPHDRACLSKDPGNKYRKKGLI